MLAFQPSEVCFYGHFRSCAPKWADGGEVFFFFWFLPPVCTDFTAFLVNQYIRQANRVFKYQNLEKSLLDKRLSALREPWWTLYSACVVSRVLDLISVNRQHHWHFQKRCPGLHMCNHKYLIVVSLSSALRTDPLYGHIRRRYLPYSPVSHETIKTFRREKNPLFPQREEAQMESSEVATKTGRSE